MIRKVERRDFAVVTRSGNADLCLTVCRKWGGAKIARARDGGGTMGADGGWSCGGSRCGGCPGCDFCSSGTLVVRMTGSSLLVDEEEECDEMEEE